MSDRNAVILVTIRSSRSDVGEPTLRKTHTRRADQGTAHDQETRVRIRQPLADLFGDGDQQDSGDRV